MKLGENRPAFPEHYGEDLLGGINVREYFAAKAMQGMLANENAPRTETTLAQKAVQYADALIEELAKPTT